MRSGKDDFKFVNREDELAFLLSLVPPACQQSSLAIIRAPSGFGKSTLTDKVVDHAKTSEQLVAVIDPSIRLKSGDARVYDGYYIQRCAQDLSRQAKGNYLSDFNAFSGQRRWKTFKEKKKADVVRKYPNATSLYANFIEYIDRFFSTGDFDAAKVLTSDTRAAITICREYAEFVCDSSSLVSVIREAQHIDHESLRFFLQSNRMFRGQHLIIEYTSDDGRFDPDHEKILMREIDDHPNAHILELAPLGQLHLETLIRTYVKGDFTLTSDYYLEWDGNIRSVMELKYRVGIGRKINGSSDIGRSLIDLKGGLRDRFRELNRLQKLLMAIVVSHVEAIHRHTLLAVAARLDKHSTATARERDLEELVENYRFLESRYEFVYVQNEDVTGSISDIAEFMGMSALAQKGLRDYYMEIINAKDFTAAAMSVAVRQALALCAKTRDTTSMLRLMNRLSGDIRQANDQSVYVDAIVEAVFGKEDLFQAEHEALVDWAAAFAYGTGDFKRAARLLDSLSVLNAYHGTMLACCAQEVGQHQRALDIVRSNRASWHGVDAQLTADLIEMIVARSQANIDQARSIFRGVRENEPFNISPLFGYALRFSETINEFPDATPHVLESVDRFERDGLTKSQAYSLLAAAMHLAREGKVTAALESVERASELLVGEIRDQHILLNNKAAVTMLSERPGFEECVTWLNAAMRTSRDDYSDTVILNNLAIANSRAGLLSEAVDCVERMLTILEAPDFADRNIFWGVGFTAMKVFQEAGHMERSDWARVISQEKASRSTTYHAYWEYRFGLRADAEPKFDYMLRFDYHPLFLSHWLIDLEGLMLLKTGSPR